MSFPCFCFCALERARVCCSVQRHIPAAITPAALAATTIVHIVHSSFRFIALVSDSHEAHDPRRYEVRKVVRSLCFLHVCVCRQHYFSDDVARYPRRGRYRRAPAGTHTRHRPVCVSRASAPCTPTHMSLNWSLEARAAGRPSTYSLSSLSCGSDDMWVAMHCVSRK